MDCNFCGPYKVTGTAYGKFPNLKEEQREKIFWWVLNQQPPGTNPEITSRNFDHILSAPLPRYSERKDRFLLALDRETTRPGLRVAVRVRRLTSAAGLINEKSYAFLINDLKSSGEIETYSDNRVMLTPKGLETVEILRQLAPDSNQGFVAMWFTDETEAAWNEGIENGINAAGFRPIRIDQKEHANKICDEIIAEIRRSRFVVADYTGQRGGVYYEAGFASGLGLPVINTCRKDQMRELHFDIRQYNCIDWETEIELSQRLQARIEAVVGEGPLKSN